MRCILPFKAGVEVRVLHDSVKCTHTTTAFRSNSRDRIIQVGNLMYGLRSSNSHEVHSDLQLS